MASNFKTAPDNRYFEDYVPGIVHEFGSITVDEEEVLEFGKPYKFGMEAGSKPELLAVMALCDNDTPIICNGFKDAEFIEMAMLGPDYLKPIEAP